MNASSGLAAPFPDVPSERYRPHYEGLAVGRLLAPRCASCGNIQWPPRPCCRQCLGVTFEWIDLPTEGVVYTYTVCYRAFHAWFAERTPYGIVVAQVTPDVRIVGSCFSNVEALECGARVRADFGSRGGDHPVLTWEPAPE